MSYEVLARKWRPLRFDDVVGQGHITATLQRAVETDRVSHAYIFSGPRGCGKTSTARILARVINCEARDNGNPCNKCASCSGVIAGNNMDVMEIDGASHTGVAEVRDLQESIGYAPSQFRSKVYVIDEVHMLSTHAFNALLKTLEEPPSHVYFIFATTAPNKIPDTIKSRCQRHHFKRLEIAEIAAQLAAICDAEKVKYHDEALRLLARKADGSMRDGTSLLDQSITSSDGEVTADTVRGILGLIDQERVMAFIAGIAGNDPGAVLRLLDTSINEGLDIQELSAALLEGFRDLMLLATPGDLGDLLYMSKSEVESLRGHAEQYELADLVVIVERLCTAIPRLKTASDPRVLLESALVDLTLLERQTDIRALIARLDGGGEGRVSATAGDDRRKTRPVKPGRDALPRAAAAPDTPTETASTPAVDAGSAIDTVKGSAAVPAAHRAGAEPGEAPGLNPADLTLEKLRELWEGFVTFVRQKKVSLGVCLISGRIYAYENQRVTLRFARSFNLQKTQVESEQNARFLRTMFEKYFGVAADIACFTEGEEKAIAFEEAARKQAVPTERFSGVSEERKPVVKEIMKAFDGEIIRQGR